MGLFWFLILVVAVLAYFAVKGRIVRLREEFEAALRKATQRPRSSLPAEDMTKCPTCGAYSAPSQQKDCGKEGCPYRPDAGQRLP